VQAYRRSVSLYRGVDGLRARRLRGAAMAAAVWPPREGDAASWAGSVPVQPARDARPSAPPGASRGDSGASAVGCPLTPRQIEVVRLIAEGLTNGQIARRLVLTPGTVANHVEHILRRLEVANRAAAVTWLVRDYDGQSPSRPDEDDARRN
jgi:DNA-binding CsgD family transcriptional regulator